MINLFKIHNILAGWFDFSFGDSEEVYPISYLSDVKNELDRLFSVPFCKAYVTRLDMEAKGDLLIMSFRDSDFIYISVISTDSSEYHSVFKFNYQDFIKCYIDEMESHKELYLREFDYHEDLCSWDSHEYRLIKLENRKIILTKKEGVIVRKVYLAGPLFTREEQYQRKFDVSYLREHVEGYEFYSPIEVELSFDNPDITDAEDTHDFYYNKDMEAINDADLAIVDLSNDDNGTLVELGLLKGLGKPYIIINSDFRLCESNNMHRNSFVRGIEKEAMFISNNIEDVAAYLNDYNR